MTTELAHLFALADAYRDRTGLAEATVSYRVLKNAARISRLRSGRSDIGVGTLHGAIRWFSDHWPEGAAWPPDVIRPAQSEEHAA